MKKVPYYLLTKTIGLYLNLLGLLSPKKATELAYQLFSHPRTGRLSAVALPEILKQTQTETLSLDGHSFPAYTWPGDENVVLLVHGWESNASRWEQMIPYLQQSGYTIIAIDAPAHGLSSGKEFNVPQYAEFIHAAVKRFNPKFLIGHSIGGAACVYYQAKYQNPKIDKMVLLGAPTDLKTLIRNFAVLLSLNATIIAALEHHFIAKFKFRLEEFTGKAFGSQLHLKGIVAHDTDDQVVAFEEGKNIAGSWKNATFIETKGLGHSMHDAVLYEKITAFLKEN